MKKFYLVNKFIKQLRNSTVYRKTRFLKTFHLGIINDTTFTKENFQNSYKKTWWLFQCLIKFSILFYKKFLEKLRIIHPTKKFHIIFDSFTLLLTTICFVIIPIDMGFQIDVVSFETDSYFWGKTIKIVVFILFLFDILINFNTAYYDKGELIKKRSMIVKNYLKTGFLGDFLSLSYFYWGAIYAYPYEIWFAKFSGILFLLRLKNVKRIFNRIEEFLYIDEEFYNYLCFFKLIMRIILFSHMFSCLWYYIGISDIESGWVANLNLLNAPWWKRYTYSLYYILVVMNTVGFGDITPKNQYEIMFTICFIYFACALSAYTINSIGLILGNMNRNEREFKRNMNVLNGFMKQKKINFNLRNKIRNYLEYLWREDQIFNDSTQEIINRLSKSLKEELLLNANGVILKNFELFHNNFSENSLKKMVFIMKETKYMPGDFIYLPEETKDPSIYIVRKGKVELFIQTACQQNSFTTLQTLKKNEIFGEISFFSDRMRETGARAVTFTSVYAINRQSFIEILKENNEDYEKFCKIKDEINLYNSFQDIYVSCASCNGKHPTIFCPILHLNYSDERILQKYNYSKNQERIFFPRKKKHSSFKLFKRLNKNYAENLIFEESQQDAYMFQSADSKLQFFQKKHSLSSISSKIEEEDSQIFRVSRKNLDKEFVDPSIFRTSRKNLDKEIFEQSISDFPKKKKPPIRYNTSPDIKPHEREEKKKFSEIIDEKKKTISKNSINLDLTKESSKSKIPIKQEVSKNIMVSSSNLFKTNENKTVIFEENMKSYQVYFPHNNYDEVIPKINNTIMNSLKKKKMYNLKVVKKHWDSIGSSGTKGISEFLKVSSPIRRGGWQSEENFFKKRESSSTNEIKSFSITKNKILDFFSKWLGKNRKKTKNLKVLKKNKK